MHYLIGMLVLLVIICNQLRGRPMTGKLYRLPILLLLSSSYAVSKMPIISVGDWMVISLGVVLAFGFGMLQGRYTQLINHDGIWYISGSVVTIFVWLVSVPIKYGLNDIVISVFHLHLHLNGPSGYLIYLFSIAGLLLGKYTMLMMRHPILVKNMGRNELKLKRLREAR